MDYRKVTEEYYSSWFGDSQILADLQAGVHFVYSEERNKTQYGYSKPFALFALYQPGRIIISYGNSLAGKIDKLKEYLNTDTSLDELKEILGRELNTQINHNVKYVFDRLPERLITSRPLQKAEYSRYLEFFGAANHIAKDRLGWLSEYFQGMVRQKLCCGFFVDDVLVSCSDAPGMPYMANMVQEIGINTLEEYRQKGYAADVCICCASEIINNGKCPQWSTDINNIASQKLAERIGFERYFDLLTVTD